MLSLQGAIRGLLCLALSEMPQGAASQGVQGAAAAIVWHIRPLTAHGQKFGGGADTKTLCGREAAWDLHAEIVPRILDGSGVCVFCREEYRKILEAAEAAKGGEDG
jgi:hypothetical protein